MRAERPRRGRPRAARALSGSSARRGLRRERRARRARRGAVEHRRGERGRRRPPAGDSVGSASQIFAARAQRRARMPSPSGRPRPDARDPPPAAEQPHREPAACSKDFGPTPLRNLRRAARAAKARGGASTVAAARLAVRFRRRRRACHDHNEPYSPPTKHTHDHGCAIEPAPSSRAGQKLTNHMQPKAINLGNKAM